MHNSFILIPSCFLLAFIPQFASAISKHVHSTYQNLTAGCNCNIPLFGSMFEIVNANVCVHSWMNTQINLNIYYVQWHRDASLHRIVYCTFARMPSSMQITRGSFLFNLNLNSKHRCAQYMHHIPNTHRMYTYFITIEYIYVWV